MWNRLDSWIDFKSTWNKNEAIERRYLYCLPNSIAMQQPMEILPSHSRLLLICITWAIHSWISFPEFYLVFSENEVASPEIEYTRLSLNN